MSLFNAVFVHSIELPPIPSSLDKDVVGEFIDQLDLVKYTTSLASVRELRDYLFKAFKDLVNKEWVSLERLDQERRAQKAHQIRETKAMMDRFIENMDRLLIDTEGALQQEANVLRQFQDMGVDWRANMSQVELTSPQFVVPQSSEIRTRGPDGGRPRGATGATETTEIGLASQELHQFENIVPINPRMSIDGLSEDERSTGPDLTFGTTRFRHWLSEEYVVRHEIRTVSFRSSRELRHNISWPNAPKPSWESHSRCQNAIGIFVIVRRTMVVAAVETGGSRSDNSSTVQASSLVNLARQNRSQNQNTPVSRYESNQGTPLSAAGVSDRVAMRASSTPLGQNSDPGLSFIRNLTYDDGAIPLSVLGGAASTPIGPSLPGQHSLELELDSGTLVLPTDGDETAAMAQAGLSVVRSRLGGTPSLTPFPYFQPRLPVIDEEHHRPLTLTRGSRELQMSLPPEEAPLSPPREWIGVFRPRDQLVNYVEGPAPRRAARVRRPRVRAPHRPVAVPTPPTTPEQPIRGEEAMRSNRHIATTFMSDFLQNAAAVVDPSRLPEVMPPPIDIQSLGLPQIDPATSATNSMELAHDLQKICDSGASMPSKAAFQDLEVAPLDISVNAQDQMAPFDSAAALLPPINSTPIVQDPNKIIVGPINAHETKPEMVDKSNLLNTSVQLMPMDIDDAPLQVSSTLANMSDNAYVTDVQVLPTLEIQSFNIASIDADASRIKVDSTVTSTEGLQTQKEPRTATQSPLNRVSIKDLAFISQHANMLRLMVDRHKQLSEEGKSRLLFSREGSFSYYSMPAVKVYDPKIIIHMEKDKIRLVHGLFEVLIRQPQVDMQNASFIRNRRDAVITCRYLLELKTANFINLSSDGRFFSLR
ncbi:sister chromatid cohesion protein solo [Drosophila subpulchrella]|uniref:sister chromatid cohesion protein solo n=1 Tax=Drosophila subpulchrella TaxID=1486046 RepID=UPI0018A14B15|nr:sister chromatid cohesion protein solo [Drosophila subpulchrella]